MLMIILSHTEAPRIYSRFYTPVFLNGYFWISGFMTKSGRCFKQFATSKIKGLLIPFLTLGIINSLIATIVEGDAISDRLLFLISRRGLWDDLWFIACLFSMQCLFWVIESICLFIDKNRTQKYWSMLFGCSISISIVAQYYVNTINVPLPFQFESACISLLFMTFGFLWGFIENKILISNIKYCLFSFLLYFFLVYLFDNKVSVHNAQYGSFLIYSLSALTGIFALMTLCKKVEEKHHLVFITRMVVFIGQNTLVYYAFQSKVIKIIKIIAIYLAMPQNTYIFPFVVTIVTAIVLAIPAFIMSQFLPAFVGKKG